MISAGESVGRITAEVVDAFRRDGVVFLEQALDPQWLALVELGLQRMLRDPGQLKHRFYDDQPGEFLETVRNFEVCPEIQRFAFDSPLADMMSVLLDSDDIWLYSDEFFIKDGAGCERTPWHQDLPFWPLEGDKIASMWISLDPIPAKECLEYVRGSHRGIRYDGFNPRTVADDPTAPFYGEELPPLPDIEAERDRWDIVSWDVRPGDVILAHPGVLHGGGPTFESGRRRALTIRCYGDDIVYAERPASRPTVPYTPGLGLTLSPGDPLRSPWYPRLRPVPPWQRADQ